MNEITSEQLAKNFAEAQVCETQMKLRQSCSDCESFRIVAEFGSNTLRNLLRKAGIDTYGKFLDFEAERLMAIPGVGKTKVAIFRHAQRLFNCGSRCLVAPAPVGIETKVNIPSGAADVPKAEKVKDVLEMHAKEFDSLSDMIRKIVQCFIELTPTRETVMKKSLGLLDATRNYTLAEIGQDLGLTRERVRQIGKNILEILSLARSSCGFRDLMDVVRSFFEKCGQDAPKEALVEAVSEKFSWNMRPTLFSLHRILEELEFEGCWNIRKRQPTATDRRREVIKAVLKDAGRAGLTTPEILERSRELCCQQFPNLTITKGNVNGSKAPGIDLDGLGTRIIELNQGHRGGALSRFALNIYFYDGDIIDVLKKAGEEIRGHMERTDFAQVDIREIWPKYDEMLPNDKRMEVICAYTMLRDVKAGRLNYGHYPMISYIEEGELDEERHENQRIIHQHCPKTNFRIVIENGDGHEGEVMQERYARINLVNFTNRVINERGARAILELGLKRGDRDFMISQLEWDNLYEQYKTYYRRVSGEYYVLVHAETRQMVGFVNQMAERLRLNARAEIVM